MRMYQVSALAILAALVSGPVMAESLTEAIQTTVQNHPQVGEVSHDRRAVDEELNQANGLFLPQVDFRGDMGAAWQNRWGTGSSTPVDDGDILPNAAAQLTLQQMLFDGYNASSEVDRQENRVRSAAHRVRETSELVGLDAVEAYLNVLRSRQLIEAARSNLDAHRQLQSDIARRTRGGAGNEGDVHQAEARVSQAEATLAQIEGDLRDAEATYNRVVGHFPDNLTRPQVPMELMPATVDAAVEAALNESPTIDIKESDVRVARAKLTQTQAPLYPQVTLEGSAVRAKDQDGLRTTRDQVGAGLVMRWNLYRGGADMARKREYEARQAEAESKLSDTQRKIEQQVRQAWAARESARVRAERYAQQVTANQQVLEAYKKQFDAGERTLLDVLDAQNELFVSTSSMLTSYYTALFGDYQVLSDRGALLASVGVAQPVEASVVSEQSKQ